MKSIRGSVRSKKRDKEEKKELISSESNNPSYVQGTCEDKSPEFALRRSTTLPSRSSMVHSPTTRRQSSITTPIMKTRRISEQPISKDNSNDPFPSPPSSPKSSKLARQLDFQKLPFNMYTTQVQTPWAESILLTIFIITLALLVPSVFVIIAFIIIKVKTDVRTKEADRNKKTFYLYFILITSLIKDLIIIVVVICFSHDVPLPSPAIGYSVLLFLWCLLLLVGPLVVFYMADAKQSFNFSTEKDKCLQILQYYNHESVKDNEVDKIMEQERYFLNQYPKLAAICRWVDEYSYLKDVLNRKKIFFVFTISIMVCISRFAVVLILEIVSPRIFPVLTNGTVFNETDSHSMRFYGPCLVLNSVISFIFSITLSFFMLYVILWGTCMIREWRYFNANESDDAKTLIGKSPQATAMWYKIRETLLLFSTSQSCLSMLMTRILFVSSIFFIFVISVSMMMMRRKHETYGRDSTIISMVIDNALLYSFILIQCFIHHSIKKERCLAMHTLELKRLNISYEISCMTNLDHDVCEREGNVRSRSRFLRGNLALLQDLVATIETTNNNSNFDFTNISAFLIGCLVFFSILYAFR